MSVKRSMIGQSLLDRREFLSLTTSAAALWLARPGFAWSKSRPTDDLSRLTLHEAAERVRRRDISPVELTQACLARIEQYDPKINAFITVAARLSLEEAEIAEKEILQGRWRGPLHGIPIALKDNIDTAGIRTTAASTLFMDRVPTQDAEVVRRLRQAGAVILGKLNMWELARSPESRWGPVRNPWALDYECSYTSNGSGAAVAAGFCFGALGTDSGGSVRLPASACGVVGLKASYGLVSNRGVIPGIDSLDHVGPLGKTVLDTALLLQGMVGYDASWSGSVRVDLPDYAAAIRAGLAPPRLGVPRAILDRGNTDPQVAQLFDSALDTVKTLGTISRDDVDIPEYLDVVHGLNAEMLAYHAPLFEKAAGRYSPSLRKILASGLEKCVSGIDYVNARRALQEARRHATDIFADEIDLLVLPTWKRLPATIAAFQKGEGGVARELWNTQPFNVLGLPAISLPCGFTKGGLPVGMQIVGKPFAETQVLAFAHAYEQATTWHSRQPAL